MCPILSDSGKRGLNFFCLSYLLRCEMLTGEGVRIDCGLQHRREEVRLVPESVEAKLEFVQITMNVLLTHSMISVA